MSATNKDNNTARQQWMATLAMANTDELLLCSKTLVRKESFEDIRSAEVGLAQVRGRMGGTGSAFNLGDMTISRCVLRSSEGIYGYSYVSGRSKIHAQRAAELDAMLQSANHHDEVMKVVIQTLLDQQQFKDRNRREKTESTRVNFFTLVRGED